MDRIALLIEDLAAAEYRPKAALREALKHPSAVAEATLPLLEGAADGRELTPEETNLLFWGLHVLAHARDTRALAPLLRLLRHDEETLDALLGDAVTATLAKVLASLFDGDPQPLFRLILDSTVDDYVRMALLSACTFLTLEGRIDRAAMHDLLVRFDDAQAAVEEAPAWVGWEETIAHLGFRDLAPRAAAARADGRLTDEISDAGWFKDALRKAEANPDDRDRLGPYQYGYLDEPVEALDWAEEGAGEPQRNPLKDVGRNDPCPCGSGKKFKKCCLGAETVEGPWMPPGSLGR
ncbi:zinc chelation protein SecC [Methylobacterium sp. XJLW]|jgi:hypothetical protein|uniref:SEC-C motif domain-containing protein n=1 Tax=Methylobacterium oryzae CBMB20 TaxID=693986 RepID=A0A089NTM7_9HYPH|nr:MULTISPECIES: DUF1186 domain-containing protein [Methylobacterium]AIQ91296.1 SEC-C motif domain-containing protein [Methylobacterium oryzae CBMB20]AWV16832.1 zinc chelation protein SecC [Methylobacterium sp. XJLW]